MKFSANRSPKVQPVNLALFGFGYFVIAVVALYFLNPDYTLLRSFTGNYDLGSYEFLIASTFFSLGLGSLALVIGLYQGMTPPVRSWVGLLLVGIWGVGMLMAGIFPANERGGSLPKMTIVLIAGIFPVKTQAYPDTIYSFVHIFALIGSVFSLSLAAILLSRRLKQDKEWHSLYRLSSILAWLMIAGSILFIFVLSFPALLGHSGLSSPILFIVISTVIGVVWLFLMAIRLRFIVASSVSN